jgi:hypothetical protein
MKKRTLPKKIIFEEKPPRKTKKSIDGQGQIFTRKINRAGGQRDVNISGYNA